MKENLNVREIVKFVQNKMKEIVNHTLFQMNDERTQNQLKTMIEHQLHELVEKLWDRKYIKYNVKAEGDMICADPANLYTAILAAGFDLPPAPVTLKGITRWTGPSGAVYYMEDGKPHVISPPMTEISIKWRWVVPMHKGLKYRKYYSTPKTTANPFYDANLGVPFDEEESDGDS